MQEFQKNIYFCFESESESEVAQSCLTLCDPVDRSLPGSSVHGILQARILEWVAISFFRTIAINKPCFPSSLIFSTQLSLLQLP